MKREALASFVRVKSTGVLGREIETETVRARVTLKVYRGSRERD